MRDYSRKRCRASLEAFCEGSAHACAPMELGARLGGPDGDVEQLGAEGNAANIPPCYLNPNKLPEAVARPNPKSQIGQDRERPPPNTASSCKDASAAIICKKLGVRPGPKHKAIPRWM